MPRQRAAAAFLGLTGALVVGLAVGIASQRAAPDSVLATTYGTVFADSDTSWTSLPRNIWLSGLGGDSLTGTNRVVSPGDIITISGRDGHAQVIKVTARELIDGEKFGVPGLRFQLVTGRSDNDLAGTIVRFMLAVETPVGLHVQPPADRLL
jgi:hypothetical protein